MDAAEHSARVRWQGALLADEAASLTEGAGTVSLDSGAAAGMPLTWESRTDRPGGLTSPEELIAAGLASCFSMMLAHVLAQAGSPASQIDTEAQATKRLGGDFRIAKITLRVRGAVEGIDAERFQAAAAEAERDCPAANALTGVPIELEATLV